MFYSRDYEWKLLKTLDEYGVSTEDILSSVLQYFDSNQTCAALEMCCDDWDVPYSDDEDE